ncbi:MAG: hypothetical protein CMC52_04660 [Flavobacteriaceae bacterium]|jgi:hypothetical protein|nr:hypothetical protein [Flavobacteriaceae bacterium]|tara:strand:- start:21455 stop:22018 length:564 start_codon:yes stop_codon:yes gene_type:complete
MEKKSSVLAYPENLNFEFLGVEFMRLHEHGQAIISRSKCSVNLSKRAFPFIIDRFLEENFNNFQLTDFMYLRAKGFHGPYLSSNLSSKNYKKILSKNLSREVQNELAKERVDTPKINPESLDRFNYFLDLILNRRSLCFKLNRTIKNKQEKGNKFEHEWSHALNEYHEYLIFSIDADECFTLILAYD